MDEMDRPAGELHTGGTGGKQVDVQAVSARGIDITRQGRQEAGYIGRAAGDLEPGTPLILAGGFERVLVEEPVSAQGDTREEPVVDDSLQDVDVLGVSVELEKTLVPECVADRSAGLGVGMGIGKLIVGPEGFVLSGRADPSRDVKLLPRDIVPKPVDGCRVFRPSAQRRDIGHPGIHIGGPDRMPDRLRLLEHGPVILEILLGVVDDKRRVGRIGLSPMIVPALVQEEPGQVEILPVAGDSVKLAEPDLDLLVSGKGAPLPRPEGANEQVGIFEGNVEEAALAGRDMVGDGRLIHVADVIELVADPQVRPALRSRARCRVLGVDGARREHVPVRFLGLADDGDEFIQLLPEFLVGIGAKRIGGCLHRLEDVAVVVAFSGVLALYESGRKAKIIRTARLVVQFEKIGNRHGPVGLEARRPELVFQLDLGKIRRPDRIIRLRGQELSAQRKKRKRAQDN